MKKAAQKTPAPVSLGTKRACPVCGTKFYDLAKAEITCPKCESYIDPSELRVAARLAPEPKKPPPKPAVDGEEEPGASDASLADSADVLEDVDDLDGVNDVEDIEVEDEEDEDESYD